MIKLRTTENIWLLGLFLGVTGLLASMILALVSEWTAKPIAESSMQAQLSALRKLNLPEFDNDMASEKIEIDSVEFMAARKKNKLVAVAAKGSTKQGYSGKITAMVGFDVNGKILAVQILEHSETPGLGAVVCERKFQKTIFNFTKPAPAGLAPNPVLDQMHGMDAASAGNWKISKDGGKFQYRTGATVSSRAVISLVDMICSKHAAAVKKFQEKQ